MSVTVNKPSPCTLKVLFFENSVSILKCNMTEKEFILKLIKDYKKVGGKVENLFC